MQPPPRNTSICSRLFTVIYRPFFVKGHTPQRSPPSQYKDGTAVAPFYDKTIRASWRERDSYGTEESDMELIMSGLLIGMSGMLLLLIVSVSKNSAPRRTDIHPPPK